MSGEALPRANDLGNFKPLIPTVPTHKPTKAFTSP